MERARDQGEVQLEEPGLLAQARQPAGGRAPQPQGGERGAGAPEDTEYRAPLAPAMISIFVVDVV